MREGLLRRKPGEALSHLQNKYINIFDKDRKMIEFFHEPCYTWNHVLTESQNRRRRIYG